MIDVTLPSRVTPVAILALFAAPLFSQSIDTIKAVELESLDPLAQMAFKNNDLKERERLLTLQLGSDPENRAASQALGLAILNQRVPIRALEALFHLSRAAFHDGPGALPKETRETLRTFVRNTLIAYDGNSDGIVAFIDASQAAPFPPEDLMPHPTPYSGQIGSQKVLGDRQKYLWTAVKGALQSSRSETYWPTLDGSALPKLRGTIVRIIRRGKRNVGVEIAILDGKTPEIALRISGGINSKWAIGQYLDFDSAVAIAWRRSPTFLLTCQVAASDLYWEAAQ